MDKSKKILEKLNVEHTHVSILQDYIRNGYLELNIGTFDLAEEDLYYTCSGLFMIEFMDGYIIPRMIRTKIPYAITSKINIGGCIYTMWVRSKEEAWKYISSAQYKGIS